jgi:hypothetical protein
MAPENAVSIWSLSFRGALARFRDECRQIGELDAADLDHLDRWGCADSAEEVWKKIKSLAFSPIQTYDPLDGFIISVLTARRCAESIPAFKRLDEVHKYRSACFDERADQAAQMAAYWSEVAHGEDRLAPLASKRANFYKQEASVFRAMTKRTRRARPFLISRLNRNGSQKQRAFMQLVSKWMIDVCGRPLDAEVAILNDIAFDTKDATHPHQARSARRETKRAARAGRTKRSA